MSDSLLATTVTAIARLIGDRLPAAYGMEPGPVLVTGDAESHAMPEGAPAVRWALGEDDGHLVLALTADAADVLRAGPPETSLVEALSALVEDLTGPLAALFDGIPPMIGAGEEVDAAEALEVGPGDAVSIPLDDAGTHRATIGLRMVVSDALLSPAPVDGAPVGAGPAAAPMHEQAAGEPVQGVPLPGAAPYGVGSVPLEGQPGVPGAAGAPLTAEQVGVTSDPAGMPGAPGIVGQGGGPHQRRPGAPAHLQAPSGEAHPADFASFDQLTALPGHAHPMSLLGDVEMGVTAELGRTELTVRDVLGLTPGSIIELDRAAGSPVDVVVNGTLIARGEVVVIDEEFGIRITEILGMSDEANPFPMAQ